MEDLKKGDTVFFTKDAGNSKISISFPFSTETEFNIISTGKDPCYRGVLKPAENLVFLSTLRFQYGDVSVKLLSAH